MGRDEEAIDDAAILKLFEMNRTIAFKASKLTCAFCASDFVLLAMVDSFGAEKIVNIVIYKGLL